MKIFTIAAILFIAYMIGQLSVDKFAEDNSLSKFKKPTQRISHPYREQISKTPNTAYIINKKIKIEEKTVNKFYFPSKPEENKGNHSQKTPELQAKDKPAVDFYKPSPTIISYKTSKAFENKSRHSDITKTLQNNLITFQSIGTKVFKEGGKEFPGIFTFFNLNLKEKPISLKWTVSHETKVFSRTVNYKATRNGNNRAVIFIDKKLLLDSENNNEKFLSEINVQLAFIINGTKFSFSEAKIGNIKFSNNEIDPSLRILKTSSETKIKLSDNYNSTIE